MSKVACSLFDAMAKGSHTGSSTRAQHRGSAAIAHQHFNQASHMLAPCQLTRNAKNKKLFPQKLWDLINDDKYNFCLRWSEDGQLVYLNRDQFEDSYLKTSENQFHTQKAISFVRQMNMYGFRKVDDCYYENDNFKRNCAYLLKNMIRKHPNKGSQPQAIQQLICQRQALSNGRSTPINNNTCNEPTQILIDETIVQRQAQNDHKELLLIHQQQQKQQLQINTQSPTDLTMTQEKCHLNNLQQRSNSENNSLNVLHTLLASLNSNLYQPVLQNQQIVPETSSNSPFSIDSFADLQKVYQHIFEQLLYKTST